MEVVLGRIKKRASETIQHRPIGFFTGDEETITMEGTPIDFCFSEYCLQKFRTWLEKEYGSLEKLNKSWDTDFLSWDKVMPATNDEIKNKDNWAQWLDHRQFMQTVMLDSYMKIEQWVNTKDKDVPFGTCGTRPMAAYTGIDWYHYLKKLSFLVPYSAVKNQAEVHRSFANGPMIMATAYSTGRRERYFYWQAVLNSCAGVVCSKVSYAVRPDLTVTDMSEEVGRTMRPLRRGLGKILLTAQRQSGRVGIYYSSQSAAVSWMNEYKEGRKTS